MGMRGKSDGPSLGIYFVVRYPDGWKLETFCCNATNDFGHLWYWAELSRRLAKAWALHHDRTPHQLADLLELHYDGFPRGRVTQPVQGSRYCVLNGSNLTKAMGIPRRMVEQAFGIEGRAKWIFDEHEQCTRESRDVVRRTLGIRDQWRCAPDDLFDQISIKVGG